MRAATHAARSLAATVLALGATLASPTARAEAVRPYAEGTIGPGWRVAAVSDPKDRGSGFAAVTGGGELLVGFSAGTFGAVVGGRVRGGTASGSAWLEAAGELAAQAWLGERVRLRLGVDAGQSFLAGVPAPFVGGLLGASFDVVTFAGGRAGLAISVRFDVDAILADQLTTPSTTLSFNTGIGLRY